MKKFIYCSLLCVLIASCSDKLDEKHEDPDAFTSTKIEYLFAQGAQKTIENNYGDMYTYLFRRFGIYLQVTARQEGQDKTNLYQNVTSDLGRWQDYYETRMGPLTEIDKIYNTLSEADRTYYNNFYYAGKVLQAYNTILTTDFFGDMPYSEAFTARNEIYGGEVILKPKYDSQKDIYYSVLSDLEKAAAYFGGNPSTDGTFNLQDILYKGDVEKWYKFANSLRLRYAMRISNVDAEKAQSVLNTLSEADLITTNEDNAALHVDGQDMAPDGIWRAMNESHSTAQGYYMYAPEPMVNMMTTAADPRLKVYFQPNMDDDGNVVDATMDIKGYPCSADDAIKLLNASGNNGQEFYAQYAAYNTITFRENYQLPDGVGISAAEVYFCLAEAAARGMFSGNAEAFYKKGIILSVQNYYAYYRNSDSEMEKDAAVVNADISDATLDAWIDGSSYKFEPSNALEQIATQKWLHLGILQVFENWAEYRRTDFPKLVDDRENGVLLNQENGLVRLMYPAEEASMNTENYNAQSDHNNTSTRLWWDVK